MSDWAIRFFCKCGDGVAHEVSFSDPWFFSDDLCASCGIRLRYSTSRHTVRTRGPFWNRRLEVHPDSDPLPLPPPPGAAP